jgi:allophanate hydrolase
MRSVRLRRGDVVRIGSLAGAAVLYVAVEGGFDVAPVLGSVSTYIRGGFGGVDGRALAADDRIPLVRDSASERDEWRLDGLDLRPPSRFRVIAGPQSDYFSESAMARFFAGEYRVGTGSDRMGMRLAGAPIDHLRGFDITSDGIAPGSIQVPGNGQPIVLLADRQTTGGYPKIATVISADLPALGRLPVGARIGFAPVTLAAAQTARRELHEQIARLSDRIVPLRRAGADVAARLYDSNLISGVADAQSSAA